VPGYRRGLRLPGSVVVVAGAAGAVGGAVAQALARAGARPVLVDRPSAELDALASSCGSAGRAAPVLPADLADAEAVSAAARDTVERCGRLDGWVHCPDVTGSDGAASGQGFGALTELPLNDVRRVLDVELLGAVHGARAALPLMTVQGGGVLVVVVSVHAQVARPYGAPQGMAGAGVRVLAAALRQELRIGPDRAGGARGVAVTTVLAPSVAAPGPYGRPFPRGRPERIAATVLLQLRRPRLEKVAGGPVAKAVVHGHALVPAATEWLVARASRPRASGRKTDRDRRG
jgi:NAD(P)-dependent dehydrogenase (short-subunit alcohol dehydrogenase family)